MYGTIPNGHGLLRDKKIFKEIIKSKMDEIFYSFNHDILYDEEVLRTRWTILDKFYKSKILVIGGGPSSKILDDEELQLKMRDIYDYIWSLNHFYWAFPYLEVDLFSVGPEVDLHHDDRLRSYLNDFNPILAFELHHKFVNSSEEEIRFINEDLANLNKVAFATRWYSTLGGGVRLLLLAASIGVKEVDFIGFDGPEALIKGEHAFEGTKNFLPSALRMYRPDQIKAIMWNEYDHFWKYITEKYDTRFCPIDMLDTTLNKCHSVLRLFNQTKENHDISSTT